MSQPSFDIFISGGGIAGLTAAAVLGQAGFSVILADPTLPPKNAKSAASDLRSTAFLQPARDLFERAGLWSDLAPYATPLDILRAVDTTGWPPEVRAVRDFRSDAISELPFGWNLPNWQARLLLTQSIVATGRVELKLGTGVADLLTRESEALVRLSDGSSVKAKLVIGADGRASRVRECAGISVKTVRYGQKALALAVKHERPHENVSVELYNTGGAFVLVPMRDHEGSPSSAVVWMDEGRRATELMSLDTDRFSEELTQRSANVFGALEQIGGRSIWPVVTQSAQRLSSERVILIAEAAHVLPPIGAQGLNTSLNDVAALLHVANEHSGALGSPEMLKAYENSRAFDLAARTRVIDFFNRVCRSGFPPVQSLRLNGLKAVHDIAPLRSAVMQAGLGKTTSGA